jgi:hypothetical protein
MVKCFQHIETKKIPSAKHQAETELLNNNVMEQNKDSFMEIWKPGAMWQRDPRSEGEG